MKYFNVLYVVFFTVYGQLIIKWRMSGHMLSDSNNLFAKGLWLIKIMFSDLWIMSGLIAAFAASLVWMQIIKNLNLNIAYPIMSLSFVLVFILSAVFFNEKVVWTQILGLLFIMAGVIFMGISVGK